MRRTIAVFISDTHANHKLGLLNPETVLYEDDIFTSEIVPYNPRPTPTAKRIWNWYLEDLESLREYAAGDDIVLFHDGDMTQGDRFPREWISTRKTDQIEIAFWNLMPFVDWENIRNFVFLKGTGSHELGEGSAPMLIARLFGAYIGREIQVPYHLKANVDGAIFDVAHHGPHPGTRKWLEGNVLRLYVQSFMDRHLMAHKIPPDAIVRAHFHQLVAEPVTRRADGGRYDCWAVLLPSYCSADDYARQRARAPDTITIGQVAFEIIDGRITEVKEFYRTIDIRTELTL